MVAAFRHTTEHGNPKVRCFFYCYTLRLINSQTSSPSPWHASLMGHSPRIRKTLGSDSRASVKQQATFKKILPAGTADKRLTTTTPNLSRGMVIKKCIHWQRAITPCYQVRFPSKVITRRKVGGLRWARKMHGLFHYLSTLAMES